MTARHNLQTMFVAVLAAAFVVAAPTAIVRAAQAAEEPPAPAATDEVSRETPQGEGQAEPPAKPSPDALQERLRRWRELPPEERARLMERYRQFMKLPEETRRGLYGRLGEWEKMPPEEKQRIRARLHQFRGLGPDRERAMRGRMSQWRAMSQERRLLIRKVLAVLRGLPKEKIEELKALPPDERRSQLADILKAHGIEIPETPHQGLPQEVRPRGPRGEGEGRPESPVRRRQRNGERAQEGENPAQ